MLAADAGGQVQAVQGPRVRFQFAALALGRAGVGAELYSMRRNSPWISLPCVPNPKTPEGKTAEGMGIYYMDMSRELLPDHGEELDAAGVVSDALRARRFRELIQTGLDTTFTRLESPSYYPAAAAAFKSALSDLLWQVGTREGCEIRQVRSSRTLQVFRRARDYIHDRLGEGICIAALYREPAFSRPSLERAFRAAIGTGPATYIRVLQLNHIRRDLMSESDDISIGHIAAQCGVWHWSRFSQYYCALFGELPSQTRRRSGALRIESGEL